MAETFLRDLRIGLRVLIKEKSFCALAVFVLALGICGVTTMFSVVNGVMLRGFSFPNADRLVSANFIDPTSTNFFGVNGQISVDGLRGAAPDAAIVRADGRVPQRLDRQRDGRRPAAAVHRRATRTENFLRILGVAPILGRDFTAADNKPGAEKVALIGYGIWQRDFGGAHRHRRQGRPDQRQAGHDHRRHAEGLRVSDERGALDSALQRVPAEAAQRSERRTTRRVLGLLKPGVSLDQANAEFTGLAKRFAAAYPDTNKQFNTGQVEPLIKTFTPAPAARHAAGRCSASASACCSSRAST